MYHAIEHVLEQLAVGVFLLLQFTRQAFFLGDVTESQQGIFHGMPGVKQRGGADSFPAHGAIPVTCTEHGTPHRFATQGTGNGGVRDGIGLQIFPKGFPVGQIRAGLLQFTQVGLQDTFPGLVDADDLLLWVEQHDALLQRIQHATGVFLALAQGVAECAFGTQDAGKWHADTGQRHQEHPKMQQAR